MKGIEHRKHDPLIDMGYETEDFGTKTALTAVIGFFVFVMASAAVGFWMFGYWYPEIYDREATSQPFAKRAPAPPNPLLQTNVTTKTDMKKLRAIEEKGLTSSALVDKTKGAYHIPVDRAIDLVSERGLPSRTQGAPK